MVAADWGPDRELRHRLGLLCSVIRFRGLASARLRSCGGTKAHTCADSRVGTGFLPVLNGSRHDTAGRQVAAHLTTFPSADVCGQLPV